MIMFALGVNRALVNNDAQNWYLKSLSDIHIVVNSHFQRYITYQPTQLYTLFNHFDDNISR